MIKKIIQTCSIYLSLLLTISLVSCDPAKSYEKEESNKIQAYLEKNSSLNFVLKPSGLYYLEVVKGTGSSPVMGDSAFVLYTGMFLDGTVFNSNVTSGPLYGFIVGDRNIVGFDEGIMLMAAGGKSTLLIPSKLGFGTFGHYPIAGYTPLLYDIELVRVKPATGN